jgi:hypothetical protein
MPFQLRDRRACGYVKGKECLARPTRAVHNGEIEQSAY